MNIIVFPWKYNFKFSGPSRVKFKRSKLLNKCEPLIHDFLKDFWRFRIYSSTSIILTWAPKAWADFAHSNDHVGTQKACLCGYRRISLLRHFWSNTSNTCDWNFEKKAYPQPNSNSCSQSTFLTHSEVVFSHFVSKYEEMLKHEWTKRRIGKRFCWREQTLF